MKDKKTSHNYILMLVTASLLAALNIILGKFLMIPLGTSHRISLGGIPVNIAGFAFGPVIGGAVGLVGDVVGCIMSGMPINPIIALGSCAVGVASGLIPRKWVLDNKFLGFFTVCMTSQLFGSVIIKSIGLYMWYATPLPVLALRLPVGIITAVLEAVVLKELFSQKEVLKIFRIEVKNNDRK